MIKKTGIILMLVSGNAFAASQFCQGFNVGYGDGWCGKDTLECVSPKAKACPKPKEWEENEYWAGYERGFESGHAADMDMNPFGVELKVVVKPKTRKNRT